MTPRATASMAIVQNDATRHGSAFTRHFDWLSARRKRVCGLIRSKTQTTADFIAALSQEPTIEHAEPNYLRWPCEADPPNDPFFGQLWGLENTGQTVDGTPGTAGVDIGYLEAWPIGGNSNTSATSPEPTPNPDQLTYVDTTAIGIDRRFYRVRLVPEAF